METKVFTAAAKTRMRPREVDALIGVLAAEPECGDLLRGTEGLRKVRFGVRG